eukprot:TCALIF_03045-PA protein Name:"Similar to FLT1 Vascular endothelial growth factor receptor 1 (Gallus gallus)" AED:0.35 eAED:0.35 QI:0/-1/0/1/-1/1/1/0/1179
MRVTLFVAACLCSELPSKYLASGFVVSEGEPWTLKCSKTVVTPLVTSLVNPLVWFKDNDRIDHNQRIFQTNYPLAGDKTKVDLVNSITIPSVNYTDVGLYKCRDESMDVFVREEYLFVNSSSKLICPLRPWENVFVRVSTKQTIIPCRPTHPDIKMSLIHTDINQTIDDLDKYNIEFDPKEGFVITQGIMMRHNGYFQCLAQWGNKSESLNFQLLFSAQIEKPVVPLITTQTKYWAENDNQSLECKTVLHGLLPTNLDLTWDGPQGFRDAQRTGQVAITNTRLKSEVISLLQVFDVSENFSGRYACQVQGNYDATSESIDITVIPSQSFKWELSAFNPTVSVDLFEQVRWVVHAIAPFPVKATWQTPDAKIISSDAKSHPKYSLSVRKVETVGNFEIVCQVQNVTVTDMGSYTLHISDGSNQTSLQSQINMTLYVRSPPQAKASITGVYPFHTDAVKEISIDIIGFPLNNMIATASVKTCNLQGCQLDDSRLETIFHKVSSFEGTLRFPGLVPTQNQVITIEACDNHGCLNGSFGLFYAKNGKLLSVERAIHDQQVILTCHASLLAYSSITWFLKKPNSTNEIALPRTNRSLRRNQTILDMSYSLKIDQQGNYICRGNSLTQTVFNNFNIPLPSMADYNTLEDAQLKEPKVLLTIEYPRPRFEIGKTITLNCDIISGSPVPTLSWWKDGQELKNSTNCTLSENQNQLRLLNTEADFHLGYYTCQAKNLAGEVKQSLPIEMDEAPRKRGWIKAISISMPLTLLLFLAIVGFFLRSKWNLRNKKIKDQSNSIGNDHLEVPYQNITFGCDLGSGNFGLVKKCIVSGLNEKKPKETMAVAIKMMKPNPKEEDLNELHSELRILTGIGQHEHIVTLLGAHTGALTQQKQLYLILEYCPFGNLLNILQKNRWTFQQHNMHRSKSKPFYEEVAMEEGGPKSAKSVHSESMIPLLHTKCSPGFETKLTEGFQYDNENSQQPLTAGDLYEWAKQVAMGMDYISRRGILHGDLACRNILISKYGKAKISDFGMARNIQNTNSYLKLRSMPLPVRWMSPESIVHSIFTTATDVWSFGILLWELFSLGETPYPDLKDNRIIHKIIPSSRPSCPQFASKPIFALMTSCWNTNARERPKFERVVIELNDIIDSHELDTSPRCEDSCHFQLTSSSAQVFLSPSLKHVENTPYLQ